MPPLRGTGDLVCPTCKGPKKRAWSKECAKCHRKRWRDVYHRAVMMARRRRGEKGFPISCPECGADTPVPPRGPIECPRCKWVIE